MHRFQHTIILHRVDIYVNHLLRNIEKRVKYASKCVWVFCVHMRACVCVKTSDDLLILCHTSLMICHRFRSIYFIKQMTSKNRLEILIKCLFLLFIYHYLLFLVRQIQNTQYSSPFQNHLDEANVWVTQPKNKFKYSQRKQQEQEEKEEEDQQSALAYWSSASSSSST